MKHTFRKTDKQRERRTYIQTDRQADRGKERDKQTKQNKQTNKKKTTTKKLLGFCPLYIIIMMNYSL